MTRTLLRTLTLPYENLRTLYEGGCEVRLYRNEITGSLQVGKRYDTTGLESAVAVREATLLREIRHPHVVPVADVTRVDGYEQGMDVIELIMPYYELGSVFDAMYHRNERFSVQRAIDLGAMLLLGVRELHEVRKVLHRDIKLPNVLLSSEGSALLGDLGIAVPMDADGTAEAFDEPRPWMPPEALATGRIDVRADIYQCGLLLRELLGGPLPYEEERFAIEPVARRLSAGLRAVTSADLRPPAWVPPRLRAVIAKATAPKPRDRYSSARAMADALRKAAVVDWHALIDDDDHKVWEGARNDRAGRQFRVTATRRHRDRAWKLVAQQRVTTWRRVVDDRIVPDLEDQAAREFFDEMVTIS
jgi:serine/threonine protein kinase